MSGAAILCGSAALRGGAGLVTVACPQSVWPIIAAANPCFMTFPLPESEHGLSPLAVEWLSTFPPKADAVVIGPGLGTNQAVETVVNVIAKSAKIPVVLDADALNMVDVPASLSTHDGPRVLTPHPGEFARLLHLTIAEVQSRREELSIEFAQKFGVVVVLKGHGTIVCDGARLYRNTTGNPGMATGGSGDVLAGLIGALLGQGLEPFAAAQLGVFLHGRAGDLARVHFGEVSLTAMDLLDYLPKAFLSLDGPSPAKGL
jgi:NAD(P)H-hydrate epimerase